MIRIITNLGAEGHVSAITIVRPIVVSFCLVAFLLLICKFVVPACYNTWYERKDRGCLGVLSRLAQCDFFPFLLHSALLVGLVSAGSYAGTSPLFAAYIAGALISWWDESGFRHRSGLTSGALELQAVDSRPRGAGTNDANLASDENKPQLHRITGKGVYNTFYSSPVHRLLKPFFFVSLPISPHLSPLIIFRRQSASASPSLSFSVLEFSGADSFTPCL
jgi:hypothetical protein